MESIGLPGNGKYHNMCFAACYWYDIVTTN